MTTGTTTTDVVGELYEPLLVQARQDFENEGAFPRASDPNADPETLNRFIIAFCSLGTQMTRPVDRWIRSAGERCVELGYPDLGAALVRHADHEAGHDQMMADDTHTLVAMWNERGRQQLEAQTLIERPPTPGVRRYIDLHEETIAGPTPFCQLAIEFEIERLSVKCGPPMMANIARACGPEIVSSLSFMRDHIAVDEAHTVFNRRQLNQFIGEHPQHVDALAGAGVQALQTYAAFLDNCWSDARDE